MPSGPTVSFAGQGHLRVLDHHRARLFETLEALADDLHRLAHLLDAQPVPGVGVALGAHRHVEVVGLVAAVGRVLAHVGRDARRPQHGPVTPSARASSADSRRPRRCARARSGSRRAAARSRRYAEALEEPLDLGDALVGHVHDHAADPDVRVVHPQPGDLLEDVEEHLALAEPVEHDAHRAELHAPGGEPHEVRRDAIQLVHQHPDHLGEGAPRRRAAARPRGSTRAR